MSPSPRKCPETAAATRSTRLEARHGQAVGHLEALSLPTGLPAWQCSQCREILSDPAVAAAHTTTPHTQAA